MSVFLGMYFVSNELSALSEPWKASFQELPASLKVQMALETGPSFRVKICGSKLTRKAGVSRLGYPYFS